MNKINNIKDIKIYQGCNIPKSYLHNGQYSKLKLMKITIYMKVKFYQSGNIQSRGLPYLQHTEYLKVTKSSQYMPESIYTIVKIYLINRKV